MPRPKAISINTAASAWMLAITPFALGLHAQQPDGRQTSLDTKADPVDPAYLDALVKQLGAAEYEDREAADEELREIGLPAVKTLALAFRQNDDYEKSLRIQHIAEYSYFWDRVIGRNGFLGIEHKLYDESGDPRIPTGTAAIMINRIVPDTSAERAGLLAGDIILAVNGNMLPVGATLTEFADQIGTRLPGTELAFDIVRGSQRLTQRINIGHRPAIYYTRSRVNARLTKQYDEAIEKFPEWWIANFGSWSARYDDDPGFGEHEFPQLRAPRHDDDE